MGARRSPARARPRTECAGCGCAPRRCPPARGSRRPGATPGGAGSGARSRPRSSASRPPAAGPPGRPRRAARPDRARASRRRPASPGAGRGCRRCGGAASDASGRVSGSACSAALAQCTPCASGAPMCGDPSETTWRTRPTQASPRSAAWWQADRATSPPIECPTSAIRSTSTGQPATSRLEQVGQLQAVVGDVAAGVVAQLDRREAELLAQPAAVGRAVRPGAARATRTRSPSGRAGTPRAGRWRPGRRPAAPPARVRPAYRRAGRPSARAGRCARSRGGRRSVR